MRLEFPPFGNRKLARLLIVPCKAHVVFTKSRAATTVISCQTSPFERSVGLRSPSAVCPESHRLAVAVTWYVAHTTEAYDQPWQEELGCTGNAATDVHGISQGCNSCADRHGFQRHVYPELV